MENRRIIYGKSHVHIQDLRLAETCECAECGAAGGLGQNRVLIVRRGTPSEIIYCFACWNRLQKNYEWVGVYCFAAFAPDKSDLQLGLLIHNLLGMPFNKLVPITGGFLLVSNEVKCRQPSLFG